MKKLLLGFVCFLVFLSGCSNGEEEVKDKEKKEDKVSDVEDKDEKEVAEPVDVEDTPTSVFTPTDVSDQTIGSIETYDDYLLMYQKIIENYFADYENAVKDTILYDQASFEAMKTQYNQGFEEQKKNYESFGNKKLVGKDELVEFLINFRDGLKEYTDSLNVSL